VAPTHDATGVCFCDSVSLCKSFAFNYSAAEPYSWSGRVIQSTPRSLDDTRSVLSFITPSLSNCSFEYDRDILLSKRRGTDFMTSLYYDPIFMGHLTGEHPERPARVLSVVRCLSFAGLDAALTRATPGL